MWCAGVEERIHLSCRRLLPPDATRREVSYFYVSSLLHHKMCLSYMFSVGVNLTMHSSFGAHLYCLNAFTTSHKHPTKHGKAKTKVTPNV
jgi:hypothetical protein